MRSHFSLARTNFEMPRQNGCSYEKGSLGKDMPSIGTLVGLMLALTWQAASALLELSSSSSSSWRGLCRQPDWAPHRLGARLLLESSGSQTQLHCKWHFGVLEKIFLLLMISMQQYAGLSLVVLGRLACGRTKSANLLQEGSWQKILSLLAFLGALKEACRHSCRVPVEVGLWIHNAIGHWAYQVTKNK